MPQQILDIPGQPGPIREVVITIDDGHRSLWDETLVSVAVRTEGRDLKTIFSRKAPGDHALYLDRFAAEVIALWPLACDEREFQAGCKRGWGRVRKAVARSHLV